MKTWKKGLIVIVVGVALGGLGSGYVLYQKRSLSPQPEVISTPTPKMQELTTWNDPAGFSFQYPKELSLNKHDEDNQNYAHLEFTNKDNPGNLIVWAKDTTAADSAAWVKADKRFTEGNIIDTTLGGLLAKKAIIDKMLVTGTVDDGIVFTIESTSEDSGYWSKVHDTIASSFKFTPVGGASSGGAPEEPVDEEEIIQ